MKQSHLNLEFPILPLCFIQPTTLLVYYYYFKLRTVAEQVLTVKTL